MVPESQHKGGEREMVHSSSVLQVIIIFLNISFKYSEKFKFFSKIRHITYFIFRRMEQEKLKRHGSSVSLLSNSQSIGSAKMKASELPDKLAECETFKEILGKQIDTLQNYFDASAEMTAALGGVSNGQQKCKLPVISGDIVKKYGLQSTDFKEEAITFKVKFTQFI